MCVDRRKQIAEEKKMTQSILSPGPNWWIGKQFPTKR